MEIVFVLLWFLITGHIDNNYSILARSIMKSWEENETKFLNSRIEHSLCKESQEFDT